MLSRLATFHQCPGDIDDKGPYHALPLAVWTRHSMQLIPERQRACMASAMAGPGRVERWTLNDHDMQLTDAIPAVQGQLCSPLWRPCYIFL